MLKNKIQAILKQFNTCITFKISNNQITVYHVMNTYYLKRCGFKVQHTTLKYIMSCLKDINTININIDSIEGYGVYNQNNLVIA